MFIGFVLYAYYNSASKDLTQNFASDQFSEDKLCTSGILFRVSIPGMCSIYLASVQREFKGLSELFLLMFFLLWHFTDFLIYMMIF